MPKAIKILSIVVISFAVLFVSVGYAAISGELIISGDVQVYIAPIYISSATPLSQYSDRATVNSTTETVLNNTVTLSSSNNTVIYEIVVNNRSNNLYGYLATEADPTAYQNSEIDYGVYTNAACTKKLERRTELPAYNKETKTEGSLTFYLKITGKSVTSTDTDYQSVLNFVFKTPIDSIPAPDSADDEVAVDNAIEKFKKILNTPSSFGELKDQMSQSSDNGRWSDSYIAYVPDTINDSSYTDDDKCLELFGGELNLIINGSEYQVYFLLKRENVDGSTSTGDANGEEYTLYMTTNPLTDSSGVFSQKYANVYASVFTSNDDGASWYELGDMLTGEAPICDYSGGITSIFNRPTGSGSFHTDTWKTIESYYNVAKGNDVTAVMSKTAYDVSALKAQMDSALSIMQGEYYETIYTEESRTKLENTYASAQALYNNYASYTQAQVVSCTSMLKQAISLLEDAI